MLLKRFKFICWSILGVAAFYFSFNFWDMLLGSMIWEMYFMLPTPLFILITFFLIMFLCRAMGCLFFMPKPHLKAILDNGEAEPSLSQMILRSFSLPFLKRTGMYVLLIAAELILRLVSILLFMYILDHTYFLWESIIRKSSLLVLASWAILAFLVMELPWYFLFYKTSFGGRPNRSREYWFGFKVFLLVLGIFVIRTVLENILFITDVAANQEPPLYKQVLFDLLFIGLCIGLWYLMYRAKCCCVSRCPICAKIGQFFHRCRCDTPAVEPKDETEEKPVTQKVSDSGKE